MPGSQVGDDVADRNRGIKIILLTNRYGHERAQRVPGVLALVVKVVTQRSRTHCQDNVVNRHIGRLADGPDTIDAPRLGDESSRTRDLRVYHRVRNMSPRHREACAETQPRRRVVLDHAQKMG